MRLTKDQLYRPSVQVGSSVSTTTTDISNHVNAKGDGTEAQPPTNKVHHAAAIAIADAGSLITATDVEGALQEIAQSAGSVDLSAHVNANGSGGSSIPPTNKVHNAAAIAIADANSRITATDVENSIQELAGSGRTSETIKGNADNLTSHKNANGSGGSSTPPTNKVHNAAAIAIADAGGLITATDVEGALQEIAQSAGSVDLSAHVNANGSGGSSTPPTNKVHNAAAIAIADANSRITATDVEGALQEKSLEIVKAFHSFDMADDDFPVRQCWLRNSQADNTLSTSVGTPITITSVSNTNGTFGGVAYDGYVDLSWIPYRTNLLSPVSGHEWAMIDLAYHDGGAEPGRTGDYTERYKIIGGDYANKRLYYVVSYGTETNLTTGHKVLLYNPWEEGNGWEWLNSGNYLIGNGSAGSWRDLFVDGGPIFQRSDGVYIMLVSGRKNGSPKHSQIGAFQSSDLVSWSVMNSDQPYFVYAGGTSWRSIDVSCGNGLVYLESEDRYFLICNGLDQNSRNTVGWIKFDENFTNIEYAPAAVLQSASYNYMFCTVIRTGSTFRLHYVVDEAPVDVYNWKYKWATASNPEGPYSNHVDCWDATALANIRANDGLWCSSHFTDIRPFLWRGRLWAFGHGCAKWNSAGNRGNLEVGLLYWDERLSTPGWVFDKRSPIFINAMYANTYLWPSLNWQADHAGGRENLFQKDDYLYFFYGGSNGTDTYKISGRRVKLTVK